ncbi:MAG: hypothetical protein IJ696_07760 [Ruminococcus sp.]|nr:hypothetical protein [Ruminococcus sp.]
MICRRCLLSETDFDGIYKNIKQKIALMDDEKRADEKVYEKRLAECLECNNLSNGICSLCGCFVEMRAAAGESFCPDTYDRWEGL